MINIMIWLAALLCPNSQQSGNTINGETLYTNTASSNPGTGGENGGIPPPPPPPPPPAEPGD